MELMRQIDSINEKLGNVDLLAQKNADQKIEELNQLHYSGCNLRKNALKR